MSVRLIANTARGYNAIAGQRPHGVAAANDLDGAQVVSVIPTPLKTMFKSKEIYINDELINNNTNSADYILWIRHLSTQVKTDYRDSDQINIAIHNTPGNSDSTANVYSRNADNAYTDNSTPHADYCVNRGAYRIARIFNNGALVRVIDDFDGACFNENGSDKYLPSDFNIKINLHRNVKTKYLHTSAAVGATVVLQLTTTAINHLMVTKDEEVKFYHTQYRFVARAVANQAQVIRENDIF